MSGFIEGEDRHQATLFPESLHVLAYNLRRVIAIMGARPLMAAILSP